MRRRRRTKVVATLGPASSDRVTIERLFAAGADVFRINMSHTNPERMRELVTMIRAIETEHGRPIGVLVDLQGPKLRLGTFKDGAAEIDTGQDFTLDADAAPGDANRVQLPHPEIFAAIKPDDTLLVDDGKLRLKATEVTPQRIVARVEVGGKVSNRKGVSLPDTVLPLAALARAVVHSAPGGRRRGEKAHPRSRRGDGEDREAASGGEAWRHSRNS
jgi:pyruvate kinase